MNLYTEIYIMLGGLFLIGYVSQMLCLRSENKLVRWVPVLKSAAELMLLLVIQVTTKTGNWLPILLMVFPGAVFLGSVLCWLIRGVLFKPKKKTPAAVGDAHE